MSVSVMILTYNEEMNLPLCLSSLEWSDDIVVIDSFSTDQTEHIVKEAGARFYQNRFDSFASQRNYGLQEIFYKHPWVLMIDADEFVPNNLAEEIRSKVSQCDATTHLFKMRRKDYLLGKWIKRSSGYPTWFERLARIGHVSGVRRGHGEEYYTDGTVGFLDNCLHHYPFNKGFHSWMEKHNRYSTAEAELAIKNGPSNWRLSDLVASDAVQKRKALKALAYSLPARPLFIFSALYFVRGGILEGRAGLTFCLLRAFYEFMIDCKYYELRRRQQCLPL
ncbi:MAG: glycosyltransferase family 2 protein [Nitrospirae bacterium]|nr:glycosyltransferase family 2 protein [Nitrospirota bacterium]